jgi:DNA polymerase
VKNIELFIPDVLEGNYDAIDDQHPPVVVVSSMLRSMLRAAPGHDLMAGDFGQIEARVLAWIAEQADQVDAFARGAKIYEEMASFIYGIPVDEIGESSEERQIGKNSVLGGGFGMGPDRFAEQVLQQTGIVLDRGEIDKDGNVIRKDMAAEAIGAYRTLNYKIKEFWYAINNAAMRAVINEGEITAVGRNNAIRFVVRGQFLWCQLPSGRFLAYAMPSIQDRKTPWGEIRPALSYMGVDSKTSKWRRHFTYGGHLTENVVQAMARDLIADAALRLNEEGYRPLLTAHDEVICEVPEGHGSLRGLLDIMTVVPDWAEGLPIAADGWKGQRYRK